MGDPASMSVLSLVATAALVILLAASTLSFTGMIDQANHKTQEQWVKDQLRPRVQDVCKSSKSPLPPDRSLEQEFSGGELKIILRGDHISSMDAVYSLVMEKDRDYLFNVDLVEKSDCGGVQVNVQGDLDEPKDVQVKSDGSGGAEIMVR